jgi:hypothetical protein
MKLARDIKPTPASGFSKRSGFVLGKRTLGFFGLRERVSFFVHRF